MAVMRTSRPIANTGLAWFLSFSSPRVTYDPGTSAALEGALLLGWHTLSFPPIPLTHISVRSLTFVLLGSDVCTTDECL